MISIFIVNLVRDIDRRKYISTQLEKLGLDYEFVEAVDKRSLTSHHYSLYDDESVKRRVGRSLSKGELACALSHAHAWSTALSRDIPHALILEDDAELGPELIQTIGNLALFPPDWDMINLCTTAPQEPTDKILPGDLEIGRITNKMSGTVAYCVTRKGLETMLEHVYPIKAAADGLLSSLAIMGHLRCYGTSPQIVRPSAKFNSSIWQNQTMNIKNYGIHPDYVQRREPVQNFMDHIEASAKYQIGVYKRAKAHYHSGKVLDIGCGVGDKLAQFFPKDVTLGLDLPPAIDIAKSRHPDRKWGESDFTKVPKGAFSIVISADVIEHILDPDDLLDFIEKINFDLFVMSTPDRDTLPWGKSGPPHNPTHYREWNQREFREYIGSRFIIKDQYQCKEPGYYSQVIEFTNN